MKISTDKNELLRHLQTIARVASSRSAIQALSGVQLAAGDAGGDRLAVGERGERIGAVAPRFHGAPTNRSHRVTLEVDCPDLLARCQADAVDAAVLVANCPVCHQSVSLAARLLEQHGIATVVMGCAKDIVEHVGVPRFLYSDFPLGNAAGRPNDPASHAFTLELALRLLEAAPAPRTTVQSPLRWSPNPDWKLDYCNIARLSAAEIERRRAEFDQAKAQTKQLRAKGA